MRPWRPWDYGAQEPSETLREQRYGYLTAPPVMPAMKRSRKRL